MQHLSRPVEDFEVGDFPDPPRLRDPVFEIMWLLKGMLIMQALNLFATLALLLR